MNINNSANPTPQALKGVYTMVFQFGHVGPHELLGPFNPFQVVRTPTEQGIPFGTIENGWPFFLDPHHLMSLGLTGGTSIQFLADRDSGKTTAAQVFGFRNSALQATEGVRRRVSVDDTRRNAGVPEYYAFAKALGGTHVDLAKHRINILDPKMKMNEAEQHAVIRAACETISHRELTLSERIALLVGITVLIKEGGSATSVNLLQLIMSTLKMTDYASYMKARSDQALELIQSTATHSALSSRLQQEANVTWEDFRRACESISEMLLLLLEEYGEVFGGTNSLYEVLSSPVVALDFTGLDDDAIPLVEMLLWMWRNAAVRRHDHNLMAHIELHDENWKRWESLTYGRNMVNHLKKIRGSGAMIVKIMHRPSDIYQVGERGSRAQALAMTGLRETDIWFVGKTPRSEFDHLQPLVNFPRKYLDRLPRLGKGDFVVKIGEKMPPFQIHLDITAREEKMVKDNNKASRTQAAMTGRAVRR